MKKILVAILVLALVAPAMAVTFTGTDLGGGKARISYNVPAGEVLRGVALNVNTTVGTATIANAAAVTAIDPKFNTFIDYAFSNPTGYAIGAGNPLALPTGAGALTTFPASTFVLSMGALDQAGAQAGVTGAGVLCEIQYVTTGATIHVMADTIRGGAVVGDAVTQPTAFDIVLVVTVPSCRDHLTAAEQVEYDKYKTARGAAFDMTSWCWQFQCRGDANNATENVAKYRVYNLDLGILLANWKAKVDTANPAADFDHLSENVAKYRVYNNDLGVLLTYWKLKDTSLTPCPSYMP